MMSMQGIVPLTKEAAEKTARSIFVGNIPYEATEEKLVELFSKTGPVMSFRLVYDRESGKPKGYGFCEYGNAAIACSALRNLQNIEFNGRPLRIGPAAGEQNSAELALSNPLVGPPIESSFGDTVDPQAAPEAISRAVASLPPEQMYELMKQMKLCIQNNPNEARNMLLQNPQLAYALLQAQIVMKIVDPKVAIAMLNRSHDQIPPAMPDSTSSSGITSKPAPLPASLVQHVQTQQQPQPPQQMPPVSMPSGGGGGGNGGGGNATLSQQGYTQGMIQGQSSQMPPMGHQPGMIPLPPQPHHGMYPPNQQAKPPFEFPGMSQNNRPSQPNNAPPPPHHHHQQQPFSHMGQGGGSSMVPQPPPPGVRMPSSAPTGSQVTPAMAAAAAASMGPNNLLGGQAGEQDKITLIMQVLQLSDEQIALLPDDQRRSIRILKEQVGKTGAI